MTICRKKADDVSLGQGCGCAGPTESCAAPAGQEETEEQSQGSLKLLLLRKLMRAGAFAGGTTAPSPAAAWQSGQSRPKWAGVGWWAVG